MRAEALREVGFEDRKPVIDTRECIELDLRSVGGPHLRLEPRAGYLAWRAVDVTTGKVIRCAALKTLLREIADKLPKQRAPVADEPAQYWSARDEADARAAHEGATSATLPQAFDAC